MPLLKQEVEHVPASTASRVRDRTSRGSARGRRSRGDHYVVNGQKVLDLRCPELLTTACSSPGPTGTCRNIRGISFFFCPMKQPGVEVRPLHQNHQRAALQRGLHHRRHRAGGKPARRAQIPAGGCCRRALAYERSVDGRRMPAVLAQRRAKVSGQRGNPHRARPGGRLCWTTRRCARRSRRRSAYQEAQRAETAHGPRPSIQQGTSVLHHEPRQARHVPDSARGSAGSEPRSWVRRACFEGSRSTRGRRMRTF